MTMGGFDALVTMDKNLQHQQNLSRFPIVIIVLEVFDSKFEVVQQLVPRLLARLRENITPSSIIRITLE